MVFLEGREKVELTFVLRIVLKCESRLGRGKKNRKTGNFCLYCFQTDLTAHLSLSSSY